MTGRWTAEVAARTDHIVRDGRWRTLRPLRGAGPDFTLPDSREVISFASNDYLGLSQHPAVKRAATEAIGEFGTGAGSARLIVGDRPVHHALECALAEWKDAEAAVLFPTGYMANLGVLATLGGEGTLIVSDERNHASIIDGCRMSRASIAVSRHRDAGHVAELLSSHHGLSIVVSDTVFSMDGDEAPLDDLGAACAAHGALLILDDAHAVLGGDWTPPSGLELLRVGTLSKTLGALGGFVTGPRRFVDVLVNAARPFIFTTGSSPADSAAALAALRVLRAPEGAELVDRLRSTVRRVKPGHPSPILPVVIGDEAAAVAESARLLAEHGLLIPAIRPPTVAPGTSRLRIALSALHTDAHIERLQRALDRSLACSSSA